MRSSTEKKSTTRQHIISETDEETSPPLCTSSDEEGPENSESSSSDDLYGKNAADDDIPSEFMCPLTLEVMNDPVMDKQGINFERRAIVQWLGMGRTTHPLTREPLTFSKLVPNVQLRLKIQQWKKARGMNTERNENSSSRDQSFGENFLLSNGREVQMPFLGLIEAPEDSAVHSMWSEQIAMAIAIQAGLLPRDQASSLSGNAATQGEDEANNDESQSRRRQRNNGLTSPYRRYGRRRRLVRVLDSALATLRGGNAANVAATNRTSS